MRFLKKHDYILSGIVFLLTIIGILAVYSTTYNNGLSNIFEKQLLYILVGGIVYFVISKFDYNYLSYAKIFIPIYIFNILLLMLVLLFGKEVNGVKRWIDLGVFQLQVSEFTKITVILTIASIFNNVFSKYVFKKKRTILSFLKDNLRNNLKLVLLIILVLFLSFLVFIEPSAGNATLLILIGSVTGILSIPKQKNILLFFLITFLTSNVVLGIVKVDFIYSLLLSSRVEYLGVDILLLGVTIIILLCIYFFLKVNKRILLIGLVIGILAPVILNTFWNSDILKDYQKNRVIAFFSVTDPKYQDRDSLYQIRLAKTAISTGFLTGKGFLRGDTPVPFKYTDFIYTSIAEEFGFLGSTILILLYLLLIARIVVISVRSGDTYGRIVSLGVASYLLIQFSANIAINLGLIVNTGIPLPFISYGGSSILTTFISLGLVQAIYGRAKRIDQIGLS